jgi:hypothetical protein
VSAPKPAAWEEEAVPPVSLCARCGLASCGGCAAEPVLPSNRLPWEDTPRPWLERLWQTALDTSTEPERVFAELTSGSVSPALRFAIVSETLALGSLVLLGSALLWLGAPELGLRLARDPEAIAAGLGLLAGSVLLMLVLHVLWGICLDVGAGFGQRRLDVRHGARFGLYACGWDLMTSPIGVFWSLLFAGPLRGFAPVGAAARAAWPAQRAYLESCRGFGADARRRAVRLAMIVVGVVVALTGAVLFVAMLALSRQLGY